MEDWSEEKVDVFEVGDTGHAGGVGFWLPLSWLSMPGRLFRVARGAPGRFRGGGLGPGAGEVDPGRVEQGPVPVSDCRSLHGQAGDPPSPPGALSATGGGSKPLGGSRRLVPSRHPFTLQKEPSASARGAAGPTPGESGAVVAAVPT